MQEWENRMKKILYLVYYHVVSCPSSGQIFSPNGRSIDVNPVQPGRQKKSSVNLQLFFNADDHSVIMKKVNDMFFKIFS